MLTYRLDPLSNPNSPIVCHRTEKTRCMAVRGGKEEPDGGIRRPTCERGGMLWGVYVCLPVLERGRCWAGAPCALPACRHSGPGGRFLTPIYGRQRYIFFRFLPNLSPLFCILAGNFNWFANFFLNQVCPISLHKIIFASVLFP